MGFFKSAANVASLGLNAKLEKKQQELKNIQSHYLRLIESNELLTNQYNYKVESLDRYVDSSQLLLAKAYKLIGFKKSFCFQVNFNQLSNDNAANLINHIDEHNSLSTVTKGGSIGTAASATAWIGTSTFGTASTGTAISSLSGAAATNATLANLGGGSLATGGAGMLGGTLLLGALPAIGIVAFSAYKASQKIDDVNEQLKQIKDEYERVKRHNSNVKKRYNNLMDFDDEIYIKVESLRNCLQFCTLLLYPHGIFSKFKWMLITWFFRRRYTHKQNFYLNELAWLIEDLHKTLIVLEAESTA